MALPLGGCGEIGMNLNPFGHDGHWLMVDCGVTQQGERGNRVQMPDPDFIAQHCDNWWDCLLPMHIRSYRRDTPSGSILNAPFMLPNSPPM